MNRNIIKHNESPVIIILYAICIALIIKSFFIDIMIVNGNSMNPTIKEDEILIINNQAYGLNIPIMNKTIFHWKEPKPGEIIIIKNPIDNKKVVKRCIGSSGNNIIKYKNQIIINKVKIDLKNQNSFINYDKIPEKSIFVLGDNIENSYDSRNYGFINLEKVLGKVIYIKGKKKLND